MLPGRAAVAGGVWSNVKSLKPEGSSCLVSCLVFDLSQCEVVCNGFMAAGFLRRARVLAFSLPYHVVSISISAALC